MRPRDASSEFWKGKKSDYQTKKFSLGVTIPKKRRNSPAQNSFPILRLLLSKDRSETLCGYGDNQWSSYGLTPPFMVCFPLVLDHFCAAGEHFWGGISGFYGFTPLLVIDHSENKGGKTIGTPLI